MEPEELEATIRTAVAATIVSLLLGLGLGLVVGMQVSMASPRYDLVLLLIGWSLILATTAFAVGARMKAKLDRVRAKEEVEVAGVDVYG